MIPSWKCELFLYFFLFASIYFINTMKTLPENLIYFLINQEDKNMPGLIGILFLAFLLIFKILY